MSRVALRNGALRSSPTAGLRAPEPDIVVRAAALAVLTVCAATVLAAGLFDVEAERIVAWLPPCPFRAITGIPCPGCGITRALLHLAELRLGEALALHPFAPLLAAGLMVTAVRPSSLQRIPSTLAWPALAALLGLWLVRLATATAS